MSHPYPFAKEGVFMSRISFYSDSSQLLPHSVLQVKGKCVGWAGCSILCPASRGSDFNRI